ncbi:MAG TPA: 2Fe-2S iron-sulfur cluster-binding protein [Chitinophagales bacterium]|nr:2Fe-2S iron-sulfur cluster binding domain-containing protein [Chitinophagales bacterium]HMU97424.1 2Fe-2S iron-sulfur cluster-binding protein [Chitinophagales bacterium]HMV01986.1 2Fe-2S iron-sulfur cluster-binding protein [Chitinophagales bacterium]HMW93370.1 2Fe-2S iron-sulfur cluster-binding protein [Chitinophagales bacterium]HMY41696.1 2Fe-2S iron-sulfur cluster-binding protein [Chitinophagales bacterium]
MPKKVKIILDGREYNINVNDDETVLDAAIDADLDPPHACRVAACCSCKAKVMQGKVEMDDDEPLTEEEKEEGFVLTCQSHPITDDVIISYDEV